MPSFTLKTGIFFLHHERRVSWRDDKLSFSMSQFDQVAASISWDHSETTMHSGHHLKIWPVWPGKINHSATTLLRCQRCRSGGQGNQVGVAAWWIDGKIDSGENRKTLRKVWFLNLKFFRACRFSLHLNLQSLLEIQRTWRIYVNVSFRMLLGKLHIVWPRPPHWHLCSFFFCYGSCRGSWPTGLLDSNHWCLYPESFQSLKECRTEHIWGVRTYLNMSSTHSIWLVVATRLKNMKTNGKDYPIYYGK